MSKLCWITLGVVAAALAAGLAPDAVAQEAHDARRVVLHAFDKGAEGLRVEGLRDHPMRGRRTRPGGGGVLSIELPDTAKKVGSVSIPVPKGIAWTRMRALSAWVNCRPHAQMRVMRWRALDATGRPIFQRRFDVRGTGMWARMEWPLASWRWGSDRCGRWGEVRELELRLERADTTVNLDELALEPAVPGGLGCVRTTEWLERYAFGKPRIRVDRPGVSVLCAEPFDAEGLERLGDRLQRAVKWADRVGGAAVRPVGEGMPATLLIFERRTGYADFFVRLGSAWNVDISPPQGGGLAIEDLAASFWDPAKGADRPVFLHETIHAIVAQRWRIAPRLKGADWVQEGTANYLQLCVHPDSMPRTGWKEWLGKPVGERGGPVPFATLMNGSIAMRQYPQVASIIAWLVAKHPDWMPGLIRDLADGKGPEKAFEARGTTLEAAQKEWKAWFDATLVPLTAEDERHFPLPEEFK